MNPEDVIKFEEMMSNARDTWGANYQALLRVARAAKNLKEEAWDSAKPCSEHWPWEDGLKEALKEVEDLLK